MMSKEAKWLAETSKWQVELNLALARVSLENAKAYLSVCLSPDRETDLRTIVCAQQKVLQHEERVAAMLIKMEEWERANGPHRHP